MDEVRGIVTNIQKNGYRPIYFLMGDEPYFIDQLSHYIEENALSEDEKAFNQLVIYGRDVDVEGIIGHAKRYPMMAERQVVIVREAQALSRTIENLLSYVQSPQPTTVLVICYKHKTIDKRKKLYKALQKGGVVLESKKLYENRIPDWIRHWLTSRGYDITPKASQLLVEFLGTDLGKIEKELEKLTLLLPRGTKISPEHIEENIGFSKDFNNFELRKALGQRDVVRATRIVHYFTQNPKDNPIVVTIGLLYNFFSQLLKYHGLIDKSPRSVSDALGIRPFFVTEYQVAAHNYPMRKVSRIITALREVDTKSKGVDANSLSQGDLLKELLVKILNV